MSDIETKIQRLEGIEAIRTLVNRYDHLIWQNQPLATIELFAEDGVVDKGPDGGVIQGRVLTMNYLVSPAAGWE